MSSVDYSPSTPAYRACYRAVEAGSLPQVTQALASNIDVNALLNDTDEYEPEAFTALHIASNAGNLPLVELLLSHGADVDVIRNEVAAPQTPLADAAASAHPHVVASLLAHGADITALGRFGGPPLLQVLQHKREVTPRDIETVRVLLDHGADINAEASDGSYTMVRSHPSLHSHSHRLTSPFHDTQLDQASELGSAPLIQLLLAAGAHLERERVDSTPLQLAVFHNHPAAALALLDAGAHITADVLHAIASREMATLLLPRADAAAARSTCRLLHVTCTRLRVNAELVEALVATGFDVNAADPRADSPLLVLCSTQQAAPLRVVEYLLGHGADVNVRGAAGESPRVCCQSCCRERAFKLSRGLVHRVLRTQTNIEVVKALLRAGADPNAGDARGCAPLAMLTANISDYDLALFRRHLPVLDQRLALLKVLLDAGAEVNRTDPTGSMALHAVVRSWRPDSNSFGRREACRILIEGGARVDTADEEGEKPVRIAARHKDQEVLQYLAGMSSRQRMRAWCPPSYGKDEGS